MWNELESYKHKFLQMELKHMEPIAISPLVQEEFKAAQAKRHDCKYPKEKLQICERSTYFEDRAQLAYGLEALPKLIIELRSDVQNIRSCAITSLSEFLVNPINAQRALRDTEIVRLLKNALLRRHWRFTTIFNVDGMLECFRILSCYHNGAKDIAKYKTLCDALYRILYNDKLHVEVAATILRNISEKPDIVLYLYEKSDSFNKLHDIFHRDICRPKYPYNLWVHLSHFLEIAPEKAIELGFFELLHYRIVKKFPEYYGMTMKCFALTIRCKNGQQRFDEADCVALLYNIFEEEKEPLKTYEFTIMAFLHGLQSKAAMRRCHDFVNLPKIMTKWALKVHRNNSRLQLYALKVLRQLGEMPCVKEYMRENCEKQLRTMVCLQKNNDCERVKLVEWLNREIFETESDIYT